MNRPLQLAATSLFLLTFAANAQGPTEEKLPDGIRLRLGSNRFREPNYVSAVGLSPDGKTLAVCGGNQIIRLLDATTGLERKRFTVREYLRTQQILFTPDGKQLLTAGQNGLYFWDAETGAMAKQVASANRDGRDGLMHLSDDGKFATVGSQYDNGQVKIIDVAAGSQVVAVKPLQANNIQGTISPKGESFATWGQHYGGNDNSIGRTVQLWESKTGKELGKVVTDITQIASTRFSPDGAKLAVAGIGMVQLFDVATQKLERWYAGRSAIGSHLTFSADGKFLAAAGGDGSVQMWETATGKRAGQCEGPTANVAGLRFLPDGRLIAWAFTSSSIDLWEAPSGKRISPAGGHSAPVTTVLFGMDGKTLISSSTDGRILRWDATTGTEIGPIEFKTTEAQKMAGFHRRFHGATYISPDGKYMIGYGASGNGLGVWDIEAGQEQYSLNGPTGPVDAGALVAFSPDSRRLTAITRYRREQVFPIRAWDVESGLPLPAMKGHQGDFTGAGFSSDGNILVTAAYFYPPNGGQTSEAWAWELATGKTLSKLQIPNTQIMSVIFLDHRLYLPFVSNNQTQKIYDAITGSEVRALEGSVTPQSTAHAISPDRRLLAFALQGYDQHRPDGQITPGNRKVVVWEVSTGSIRHELSGLTSNVTALGFSRDGRTLACGCGDTTILMWDLAGKVEAGSPLLAAELAEVWKTLEMSSAKKGEDAIRRLVGRPTESVAYLSDVFRPAEAPKTDSARIAKLIADLDAGRYAVREAAMKSLEQLGTLAREPVFDALKRTDLSPEMRERLEKLKDRVNKPDTGTEWVRPLRAIEALERIGTAESIAHLKAIAAGGDSPSTRAAREAVGRLRK